MADLWNNWFPYDILKQILVLNILWTRELAKHKSRFINIKDSQSYIEFEWTDTFKTWKNTKRLLNVGLGQMILFLKKNTFKHITMTKIKANMTKLLVSRTSIWLIKQNLKLGMLLTKD